MYKPLVEMDVNTNIPNFVDEFAKATEERLVTEVNLRFGMTVDVEGLRKALQGDYESYDQGWQDGFNAGYEAGKAEKLS